MPKKMDRGTYVNNMQFLHICDILMIYMPFTCMCKNKTKMKHFNVVFFTK